jgi:hypothetical protein
MANPYEQKKPNDKNKSGVSNIGGAMSSPTPVTDAMNLESIRRPLETIQGNQFVNMQKPVKKYAKGGGTRPVRR